jgi:hypothetical protein
MKNITLALLLVLFSAELIFSRDKPEGTISHVNNISPDGNTNYVSQPVSNELKALIKEVKKAKNGGNLAMIKFYQDKINSLTGASTLNSISESSLSVQFGSQLDNQNFTNLNSSHTISSGAIATDRVTGTIWTVYTNAISDVCDEMYFYKSTNNGLSWTNPFHFSISALPNLNYRNNEIDIEIVNRGDSTFIWGVAGVENGTGISSVIVFKTRADGTDLNVRFIAPQITDKKYRYPRITSDNARYTTGSYIYIAYTLDSVLTGAKIMKSKFLVCENPFAPIPDLIQKSSSPAGAYWWNTASVPDSAFMQSDVCYVNTPGDSDIVVTSTVLRGTGTFSGQNVYMTNSNDYGTTIGPTYAIGDSKFLETPKIASPGYNCRNVMIATRRLFGNGDWDCYYYYSTNLNANNGNFNQMGYVANNSDTTLSVDLKARYRSFDNFLFAYADKNQDQNGLRSNVMGRPFKQGALQDIYSANPAGTYGTGTWGAPVAGFRNVNNDSCIIGWSTSTGFGYNITGGTGGTVTGTGTVSMTANDFSLEQNFPNPFNPSTKISFTIQQNLLAKLTVYDIMGREIAKLIDGQLTAGAHSVDFNAAALPSGVYYYKLEANGFSDVKKMMLVK